MGADTKANTSGAGSSGGRPYSERLQRRVALEALPRERAPPSGAEPSVADGPGMWRVRRSARGADTKANTGAGAH